MKTLTIFSIGILCWPILEYMLHRFLGHDLKIKTLFKKEHTRHHAETNYFAPLKLKILAAIPVCTLAILFLSYVTNSLQTGMIFTAGFLAMFSLYEWVHWTIHAKAPKTKLGMKLRKHHLAHHFHNPKMNHGVTTTIIDKLVGTYLPVSIVKVPKSIPLPWLFEPGKQTIDPKFAEHFQIK
jgi:sterol desaturase/sphingolipid hydroxylase (fatty acid hydroxylase superfamily)